ncbi:ATP-binding cassette domain-containing protein [Nesterenkonia halophila]|uniref:ATP-binding cassette domain-containing protein n=1 Tax=Nesterenkonia halophila TaxID=302044 RepID=UPI001B86B139
MSATSTPREILDGARRGTAPGVSGPSRPSASRSSARPAGVEVRAEGWTFQHADRPAPALEDLDLHLAPGEKVLLAGPSGAGKSTLLHGLAGVLHDEDAVSAGTLRLDGAAPDAARGRAGLMQQDPESQVVLSRIGDDVAFAAENLAVEREQIWERVREVLAAVGLGPGAEDADETALLLDHPTAELSGGQKQRLALAGILAMRPGLLLLDEPTANLDPAGVAQVRDAVLAAAAATGATLVVVEHRLGVWAEHCDTLVVLEAGGGVRRRVDAARVAEDEPLREELAAMGLWVPDRPPQLPTWSPRRGVADDGPAGAADETLLSAAGLAVGRTAPRRARGEGRRRGRGPGRRRRPRAGSAPRPVLEGVDLTLRRGRALGLTGRNGAGKSTLLLSLAGLLPRHGGRLVAGTGLISGSGDAGAAAGRERLGEDPGSWRAADLVARLGMVFQEPEHQFVRSTVREELALGAHQARRPGTSEPLFTAEQVEARVAELLERLRLTELAEANPFTLSGGEKRRLSVGTVLSAGPAVLLLDEPTFGQDAHTFAELVRLLREHLDAGGALIAVTHDVAFLQALDAEELRLGEEPASPERREDADAEPAAGSTVPMLSGVRSESALGRRGAPAKLAAVLLVTVALVATMDWVSSAVVIVAGLLLVPAAELRLGQFLKRLWPFAVGAVVAVWGTAVAAEASGEMLLDLGFTTVSAGSLELGAAMGARALAIVIPSVLVFSTTDPTDLADGLAQQLRLPARFVLGALAAMRLLGLLAQHWTTIGHARRARGIGAHGGFVARVGATASQAFGLLVQAIRIATRLAVTMESRGFGAGPRTWARPARTDAADVGLILGGLALAALATAVSILVGAWNPVW